MVYIFVNSSSLAVRLFCICCLYGDIQSEAWDIRIHISLYEFRHDFPIHLSIFSLIIFGSKALINALIQFSPSDFYN